MALSKITTHQADAVHRLVHQFRGKPNIEALAAVFGARAQSFEDCLDEFFLPATFSIDSATGDQLDVVGELLGWPRPTDFTDTNYRWLVKAQRLINLCSGQPEALIAIFDLLGNVWSAESTALDELGHASFRIRQSQFSGSGPQMAALLRRLKPAGVRSFFQWSQTVDAQIFRIAPEPADYETNGELVDPATIGAGTAKSSLLLGAPETGVVVLDPGGANQEVIGYTGISIHIFPPPAYSTITFDGTLSANHAAEELVVVEPGNRGLALATGLTTTLDGAHAASQGYIDLDDSSGFPATGVVTLHSMAGIGFDANEEDVTYLSISVNRLTLQSPTTKEHASGDVVRLSSPDFTLAAGDPNAGRLAYIAE